SSLTTITLGRSGIDADSLLILGKMKNLDTVGLSRCEQIGSSEGIRALCALKRIHYLELDGTRVGDEQAELISGMSKLDWLNLIGTRVSEKGLRALCRLQNLQHLKLDRRLENTRAAKEFLQSHPHCKVEFRFLPPEVGL
ncbi:MAG: hypothetical protein ACRD3W_20675, partial [Terriglobales bacterium]